MKRLFRFLSALFLMIAVSCTVFVLEVRDTHGLSVGDVYGACPDCSGSNYLVRTIYTAPGCETTGSCLCYCTDCYFRQTETIPAIGHYYEVTATVNPTCTEDGYETNVCRNCGDTYNRSLRHFGHDYHTTSTVAATCTTGGTETQTCSNCGDIKQIKTDPLGHNYRVTESVAASCTQGGYEVQTCSRCNDTRRTNTNPLGHNYKTTVTKAATCTQAGIETHTCSRCNDSYQSQIAALGHDMITRTTEASCTEGGLEVSTCSRCGLTETHEIAALGHDLGDPVIITEATCTQDGLATVTCNRCGETFENMIEKLGHAFPEEWTVEKEPTYSQEGFRYMICQRCNERIEQIIPKKTIFPIIAVIAALAGGAATLLYIFLHKKAGATVTGVAEETAEKAVMPAFEDKSVLICSDNEELIEFLKYRHYLQVSTCSFGDLSETVPDSEPDITIIAVKDQQKLDTVLQLYDNEEWQDYRYGLLLEENTYFDNKDELNKRHKEKQLVSYLMDDAGSYKVLVNMILPILKPELKSDETLENIGKVADLMGIPEISSVIDVFIAGRDIKSTLEAGELGISETSTIITDMASILGLDGLASVAGLVGDVESIRDSLNEDIGTNEAIGAVNAGKDIVDVISDIIDG